MTQPDNEVETIPSLDLLQKKKQFYVSVAKQ